MPVILTPWTIGSMQRNYLRSVMESSKPIKAGCLALVLPAPNPAFDAGIAGTVVTVIERAKDGWGEIKSKGVCLTHPWRISGGYISSEELLLRLDDPDIQKQIESEKEKVIA
jgi:hypothetical protein